jgi:hypothetical protein
MKKKGKYYIITEDIIVKQNVSTTLNGVGASPNSTVCTVTVLVMSTANYK